MRRRVVIVRNEIDAVIGVSQIDEGDGGGYVFDGEGCRRGGGFFGAVFSWGGVGWEGRLAACWEDYGENDGVVSRACEVGWRGWVLCSIALG